MRTQAASGLRGDVKARLRFLTQSPQETLGPAIPIDVRRIEEIDSELQSPLQGRHGLFIINSAPCPAHGPGAEADLGHLPAASAEFPVFHEHLPSQATICILSN